ncbi:MAG: hypothetical protein D3910_01585 [Candidatus Electrothrix sp. ATG2]|nr:hypothetical protein [Candidatus Electrothrix sp. ATG2]
MILAGIFEWTTLVIKKYVQNQPVVLFVGANNPSWEKEFGEVYMDRKGKLHPISNTKIEEVFFPNEEIKIELSSVLIKIHKMRQQIKEIDKQRLHDSRELKITLGDG